MILTMEEVAGWLREAAVVSELLYAKTKDPVDDRMILFFDRAAQVKAMGELKTCNTCLYWDTSSWKILPEIGICYLPEKKNDLSQGLVYQCGPKFGCIHHEDKQLIKESK